MNSRLSLCRDRSGLALALAAALALAGCSSVEVGGVDSGASSSHSELKSGRAAPPEKGETADERLRAMGVQFRRMTDEEDRRGCTVKDAVEITAFGKVRLTRPALLTAEMAELMARWVRDVLEPEARKSMNAELASIDVYGTYSCRNVYGRRFAGRRFGRLSEHAFANAIDIGGFAFSNGQEAHYLKNWQQGPDGAKEFLQATSLAACSSFSTTLTPDYDRFHRNHIHLDASPKKEENFCGYKGKFSPGVVPRFARFKATPPKRPARKKAATS
jgi:hypothetical protein